MFNDLTKYYKERDRLVCEGMNYMDACNKAWREIMDHGRKEK